MSDLTETIAELRRVTPSNVPWDVSDFNSIPAPIDDAICVILNAVLSGELVILTALEAERAKVARLVEGVRSVRALADHCVHGEPDCSVDDIHSELSNLLTEIKETLHE